MIETERLKIYAASQDIMERFIEAQTVDVLKAAYIEMRICAQWDHRRRRTEMGSIQVLNP